MRNKLISSVAAAAFSIAASGFAFAADMAVKAPPLPPPSPVPTWTGFYGGVQVGGAWSDEAVNYVANDPTSALILSGSPQAFIGQQAVANGYRISQKGAVGGVEAGYNWQRSNLVFGLEADFSGAGISGTASGTSILNTTLSTDTQTTAAQQSTDWYGTVRGRAGWLATPNLLLFATGGFAYGKVNASASYTTNGIDFVLATSGSPSFGAACISNVTCFAGSSSETRTGWTAGGGIEYLLDQHWSAKIEYQLVDLGSETVRIPGNICTVFFCGSLRAQSSFNAVFHDQFNVVRLGLNYKFW